MRILQAIGLVLVVSIFGSCSEPEPVQIGVTNYPINTKFDEFSYSLGVTFGSQLEQLEKTGLDSLNVELFMQGCRQAILKQETSISKEDANTIVQDYITNMRMNYMESNMKKFQEGASAGNKAVF